jgi:hypothetical protein
MGVTEVRFLEGEDLSLFYSMQIGSVPKQPIHSVPGGFVSRG